MVLNYTRAQELVFFPKKPKRFTIVTKGRRVGLTRGAAQAFVEYALQNKYRMLWGETIFSNVQRYIELYFLPILEQLPVGTWEWRTKMMQLKIMETVIDFRSADNPEMWEGFGYNKIFINEAGIILKNPDLYKKTILPMLMDYPNSELIAAGVPKGKKLKDGTVHPFYQLWENAEADTVNYARHRFSSYSNPYLTKSNIKDIEDVLDDKIKLQEIHGEFIDITDNPFLYEFDIARHVIDSYQPTERLPIWLSLDFNINPNSCLVAQEPDQYSTTVFDEISIEGGTEQVCEIIKTRYDYWIKRGMVFIAGDATGNNRNAMSGELTNYIIIKKALGIRDSQMRVKRVNNPLDSSRAICNGILNKLEVFITKNCKQTIIDCQLAEVDAGGNLIKTNGLHKFDCFRYLLEARYPEFLKHVERYMRPKQRPQPVQPQRISINQKNETQLQPTLK